MFVSGELWLLLFGFVWLGLFVVLIVFVWFVVCGGLRFGKFGLGLVFMVVSRWLLGLVWSV